MEPTVLDTFVSPDPNTKALTGKRSKKNSPASRTNKYSTPYAFTKEEIDFVLHGLVYLGRHTKIKEAFEEKFKKEAPIKWIAQVSYSEVHLRDLERIRRNYERELSHEYLSSKRNRIRAVTGIYEICMKNKWYNVAKESIKLIHEMIEGKSIHRDEYNFYQFQQTNHYADFTLPEIKREKARLLKELEGAMISEEGETHAEQVG